MAPLSARQDVTVIPIRHNPEGGIIALFVKLDRLAEALHFT